LSDLDLFLLENHSVLQGELKATLSNQLLREMKRTLLTAITISALLISLIVIACPHSVSADSADPIHFIDAGLVIYSPVNMTYYNTNLFLNISLGSSGLMGGLDPNISMNYSIDNTYNGSVPLESNREIHVTSRAVAVTVLSDVPNGAHNLTIYLYGLNQRAANPKYLSFTPTVYFSTTSNPNLNPTINPSTPTPTMPSATVSFSPSDLFAIPALNSTLNFAYSGSYHMATFESNFWSFDGLTLAGLGSSLGSTHSLDASAQNCNVTITHIDTLSFLNHDQVGWLTYNVKGIGNQTFNMHWLAKGFVIGFKVYVDGIVKEAGDGWTMRAGKNPVTDNMLTVTGAKHIVSIGYARNPETIGSEPNFAPIPSPSPSLSPSSSPSPSVSPSSSPTQQPTLEPSPTAELSSAPRISPIKEVDYLWWLWAAIIVAIVLIIASMVYLATLGKISNRNRLKGKFSKFLSNSNRSYI
jgi:hypothetical protein